MRYARRYRGKAGRSWRLRCWKSQKSRYRVRIGSGRVKERLLKLTEHRTSPACQLSPGERDVLLTVGKIGVSPTPGLEGHYDLTPSSWVGSIDMEGLSVVIRPKLPIISVLFLLSYVMDRKHWPGSESVFSEEDGLLEAIVPSFAAQVGRATALGVLQGYVTVEDALFTVRGRVRFDDQIRRRYGVFPPAEVKYDEYTEDIEENRLLKAALTRLGRMRIRAEWSRKSLRAFDLLFQPVSLVEYHPWSLPDVEWNRLNKRYRPAVELAKLVLRATSFDLSHGSVRASAFLVDMNAIFEDFVLVALREALGLSEWVLVQGAKGKKLVLDRSGRVHLEPDVSWWEGQECVFVGDVKYKRVNAVGVKHPDLYQLLAYTVATELPQGLLIYAAGEEVPVRHEVVRLGNVLEVVTLNLRGSPDEVLGQMAWVAEIVRRQKVAGEGVLMAQRRVVIPSH
jgi:5-methylcytosine-specific restriction enzyme subunit McrC